ncbi:HAD family hydrolase [Dokdonella immobilis]|uniref:Putative hydrolase of the HAD superfamily n=1 Tax=Dokdonella immobilis TaxID=578942 RepID=A0A1I4ZN74_9GAMM|nr:HAD family hydrolase [Dokdonella immobilis]SFN51638.1 putative hydrolase of the HAD superfamily [Dokdonella immobilis]
MLELIGFDGDDTLWQSQDFYDAAQAEFERIVGAYVDLADVRVHERLLAVETRNIQAFGYGAKGMTLSMIEAAFEITGGLISSGDLHRLVGIGKEVLAHPVNLLPGIREAVEDVARRYRIVLITKGDLIHQQAKVRRSDLGDLFHRIEIVSEKDPEAYARVLEECNVQAAAFAMVGNSLRSDIAPVVELGGWGVYMPYHSTWSLETNPDFAVDNPRVVQINTASSIPAALERLGTP